MQVTVIMPVRNPDPRYFPKAVQSVLDQTLEDFELLIVEDVGERRASEDLAQFDDVRIRHLVNEGPGSMAEARNLGLSLAKAELVAMFDADDVCHPERLAMQFEQLQSDPDLGVLGSQLTILDETDRPTGARRYHLAHQDIVATLHIHNPLAHPSVMLRKSVVVDAGGYRNRVCEDYDLWCRLAKGGVRFANHPQALLSYRVHPGATKSQRLRASLRDTIAIKQEHWAGQLGVRARLRILGERCLLCLPPALVMRFFDRLYLRSSST